MNDTEKFISFQFTLLIYQDIERDFKGSNKDRKLTQERLEALEGDVNHVMGRGETSNVSGIPTLNRLLNDIDEVKGSHTKVKTEFDDFKKGINEKLDDEIRKRESDVEKLQQGQAGAEKRTEDLKDTMKNLRFTFGNFMPNMLQEI